MFIARLGVTVTAVTTETDPATDHTRSPRRSATVEKTNPPSPTALRPTGVKRLNRALAAE